MNLTTKRGRSTFYINSLSLYKLYINCGMIMQNLSLFQKFSSFTHVSFEIGFAAFAKIDKPTLLPAQIDQHLGHYCHNYFVCQLAKEAYF